MVGDVGHIPRPPREGWQSTLFAQHRPNVDDDRPHFMEVDMRLRILSCLGVAVATVVTSCAQQELAGPRSATRASGHRWENVCNPTTDAACASGRMTGGGSSISVG